MTELTNLLNAGEITQKEFDNRRNILEEASRYCNFEWTASVSFHTWKGKDGGYNDNNNMIVKGSVSKTSDYKYYIKDITYKGLPYCMNYPQNHVSINEWTNLISDKNMWGKLEGTTSNNREDCIMYGIDCAGLVLRSYKKLDTYTYGYLGTASLLDASKSPFIPTDKLKPGDILLWREDDEGHVMIYAGVSSSGIMVYESVADGGDGISGCVYRIAEDFPKYRHYEYKNISK